MIHAGRNNGFSCSPSIKGSPATEHQLQIDGKGPSTSVSQSFHHKQLRCHPDEDNRFHRVKSAPNFSTYFDVPYVIVSSRPHGRTDSIFPADGDSYDGHSEGAPIIHHHEVLTTTATSAGQRSMMNDTVDRVLSIRSSRQSVQNDRLSQTYPSSSLRHSSSVTPLSVSSRKIQPQCISASDSKASLHTSRVSGLDSQLLQATAVGDADPSRLRLMVKLGLTGFDRSSNGSYIASRTQYQSTKDRTVESSRIFRRESNRSLLSTRHRALWFGLPAAGSNIEETPKIHRPGRPLQSIDLDANDDELNGPQEGSLSHVYRIKDISDLDNACIEDDSRSQVDECDRSSNGKNERRLLFDRSSGTTTRLPSIDNHPHRKKAGESEGVMEFRLSLVHLRSREDFRINYLKRLSYANVWIPQARRPPQHQTVSIFDWDDTLLCTSYINLRGDEAAYATISKQLNAIERHGKLLLATAMKIGRVFVITNAMHGWVEYSAKKYLPGLQKTLQNITIISARHRFEGAFPGDYHRWKIQAFLEVQRTLNSQIITNLVSVGDSIIEMDAVHVMGQEFSQALIKTIKFRENPSPDELAKQLELVAQKFEKICFNAKNLKIGLERRVIQPKRRIDYQESHENSNAKLLSSNSMAFTSSSAGNLKIQQKMNIETDSSSRNF